MNISIIAAVAPHAPGGKTINSARLVIGNNGELPWRLPEDLRRFKQLTMDCPVIMGRKTFDSIGRPLPGRFNIVVSRATAAIEGCKIANSLEDAIAAAKVQNPKEIFIIGGAQIYAPSMQYARRLYLTEITRGAEGDAFFPPFNKTEWLEKERLQNGAGESRFDFVLYEKD